MPQMYFLSVFWAAGGITRLC